MIYGISLLILLLGLVIVIPAIRQIMYMRDIQKNGAKTSGTVLSSKSATGWLWTAEFGNQDRPLIRYEPAEGHEMMLEVSTSNFLPQRSYESGQAVEVTYDKTRPGRAYLSPEWRNMLRDLWLGSAAIIAAIIIWVVGRAYDLPF